MNWKSILAALCVAFFCSGCLFANFTTVLDTNLDRTELGDKVGRSRVQSVLWLVAWGDGGMYSAAKDGGITTLRHADTEVLMVLFGLYYTQSTVVYGD